MTAPGSFQVPRSTSRSIASSSSNVHSHPSASTWKSSTDMSLHHKGRSQLSIRAPTPKLHLWTFLSVVLLFMSLCSLTSAAVIEPSNGRRSWSQNLARRGEILIDRQAAPQPRSDLARRQDNGSPFGSSSPSLPSKASASTSAPSSKSAAASTELSQTTILPPSSSATGTPTSRVVAPTSLSNSPLPSPFDTSIGSNFTTASCPDFFNSFLNNVTFKSCLPLSLLLQNSQSFFKASRSPILLTQTLESSCSVDLPTCSATMSLLASTLITDSACGLDYRNENPIVIQARNGLIAYEPIYRAGCLKDQGSGNYCFADAITNQSNPSDSYPYYLPLGISLPAASRPTCDQCLQTTMSIFASAAVDRSQPLAQTFVPAGQQIDLGCGPIFVNTTVPVATVGGAPRLGFSKSAILALILGPPMWILLA